MTMAMPLATRRISVDDAIRMAEAGILHETERLELIDGRLVEMSPEGFTHHAVVGRITTLLARAYPDEFEVCSNSMLPFEEHAYVMPDVYVVPAGRTTWARPDEIPLVVEVAHTSRRYDLGVKVETYARLGIAEYWVVDLVDGRVVVHTHPAGGTYMSVRRVSRGALEVPQAGAALKVEALLGG